MCEMRLDDTFPSFPARRSSTLCCLVVGCRWHSPAATVQTECWRPSRHSTQPRRGSSVHQSWRISRIFPIVRFYFCPVSWEPRIWCRHTYIWVARLQSADSENWRWQTFPPCLCCRLCSLQFYTDFLSAFFPHQVTGVISIILFLGCWS